MRSVVDAIVQDVHERVTHLARRTKRACVVTIPEGTARAVHELVQTACEPDFETFDTGRERAAVDGFDQKVQVVGLNGELNDAHKAAAVRPANGAFDDRETALASKVDRVASEPQRDVHWVAVDVVGPARVWNDAGLLAPGVLAGATPRRGTPEGQVELFGGTGRAPHDLN
jgi:hypothetical protein